MFEKDGVILLPSYQPEETLVNLSRGLSLEGFFVLVVDDGSGEKYSHIFEKCKKYATVIGYEKNQGKGHAIKFGYKYCLDNLKDYNYVVTADGDGQHRIDDIVRIYERVKRQNVSIIGVRKFDVKVPIKSKLGNTLSKFNQSLVTARYMHDNQCGLRAFPYSILPDMIDIFKKSAVAAGPIPPRTPSVLLVFITSIITMRIYSNYQLMTKGKMLKFAERNYYPNKYEKFKRHQN